MNNGLTAVTAWAGAAGASAAGAIVAPAVGSVRALVGAAAGAVVATGAAAGVGSGWAEPQAVRATVTRAAIAILISFLTTSKVLHI